MKKLFVLAALLSAGLLHAENEKAEIKYAGNEDKNDVRKATETLLKVWKDLVILECGFLDKGTDCDLLEMEQQDDCKKMKEAMNKICYDKQVQYVYLINLKLNRENLDKSFERARVRLSDKNQN